MAPAPDNIFLTGFMGSGKSTVGARLAKEIGWKFIDTDKLIESAAGMTIAKLFETEGEPRFRAMEHQIVEQVATVKQVVIALGGGALLDDTSRALILSTGAVVYLQASVDTILARTKGSDRPLLRENSVKHLLEAREPIYQQAHLHIPTDGKTHAQVVSEIRKGIATWKK